MEVTRSMGYDPRRAPAVTIRLQEAGGEKRLDEQEVLQLIRKLRRRYGNTGGVEYEFEINRRE